MLRSLVLAVLLVLAGCATPQRGQQAATVTIDQATWRQVDQQIIAASKSAIEKAGALRPRVDGALAFVGL
nr:hypothetical protein GCM10020185_02550 [Pseudomonas brassicacearum subsp. brassicacearum]